MPEQQRADGSPWLGRQLASMCWELWQSFSMTSNLGSRKGSTGAAPMLADKSVCGKAKNVGAEVKMAAVWEGMDTAPRVQKDHSHQPTLQLMQTRSRIPNSPSFSPFFFHSSSSTSSFLPFISLFSFNLFLTLLKMLSLFSSLVSVSFSLLLFYLYQLINCFFTPKLKALWMGRHLSVEPTHMCTIQSFLLKLHYISLTGAAWEDVISSLLKLLWLAELAQDGSKRGRLWINMPPPAPPPWNLKVPTTGDIAPFEAELKLHPSKMWV